MHPPKRRKSRISEEKALEIFGEKVSEKLEDSDVKGAIRLASSEEKLAANSDATFQALLLKHLIPPVDSVIPPPPPPPPVMAIEVDESDIARAIKSFPCGSAGGPYRMRLQHLKDMLNHYKGESSPFMSSLAAICSLVLESRVPDEVCPLFYGASLTTSDKSVEAYVQLQFGVL